MHIAFVDENSPSSLLDLKSHTSVKIRELDRESTESPIQTHTYHWIEVDRCALLGVNCENPQRLRNASLEPVKSVVRGNRHRHGHDEAEVVWFSGGEVELVSSVI